MIRQAVGAIVKVKAKYLLVHKVKINTKEGKKNISGLWDFIKGGVKEKDQSLQEAILRELKEETGTNLFEVEKEYSRKIEFDFPRDVAEEIGYRSQLTTMFLVSFYGELSDICPQDDEIDNFGLFTKEEVLNMVSHSETKKYFIDTCEKGKYTSRE
ncbi:NUDIX domain-containing protein [Sutcliffiella rhizosphaerae]|uniref:RNA pyrophosphohydrolase n=1 Tax=Sutcliffiella rhizosphaerae TaxID=2880967 RepID=A0ABM8YL18_9BACI|nr:NUDIX domain-containing protein [Sutcliffiella rhizosphaerae]CAG9620642.1 RNA pyrophosphohydrolase [Sutcliffiella rhizosphaerae]